MPPDFSQSIRYHYTQAAKRQDHENNSFEDTREEYKQETKHGKNDPNGNNERQHRIPPPGKGGNR